MPDRQPSTFEAQPLGDFSFGAAGSTVVHAPTPSASPIASQHAPTGARDIHIPKKPATFKTGPNLILVDIRTDQPAHQMHIKPSFEFGEHRFLGDTIVLQWDEGVKIPAKRTPFLLQSGVSATYGSINAMAGDFYGTNKPICQGTSPTDTAERFLAAYRSLAVCDTKRVLKEYTALYKLLMEEVKAVGRNPQNSAKVYHELPDHTWEFEKITWWRPHGYPSYVGLAGMNLDHFGADAHKAWWHGHQVAMAKAASGKTKENLSEAYAMNAFADHFLQDSFSAGHLRTPRRALHGEINKFLDLCAECMHDEDNAIGLEVNNAEEPDKKWKVYGDKMLLEAVNDENRKRLLQALQVSVDEIYAAWKDQKVLSVQQQRVLTLVPTLESANGPQQLFPLFSPDGSQRRLDLQDRTNGEYTDDWLSSVTWAECRLSKWWEYPITIQGGGQ